MEANNESSFERSKEEYEIIREETDGARIFLVVNKIDLIIGYNTSDQ
jgi:GTPase SAR1 family protein